MGDTEDQEVFVPPNELYDFCPKSSCKNKMFLTKAAHHEHIKATDTERVKHESRTETDTFVTGISNTKDEKTSKERREDILWDGYERYARALKEDFDPEELVDGPLSEEDRIRLTCREERRRNRMDLEIRNRVLFHSPGKVGKPTLFFQQNQTLDGKSYVAVKNYVSEETEEELNDRMEQLNARRTQGGTAAGGTNVARQGQSAPIPNPNPQ